MYRRLKYIVYVYIIVGVYEIRVICTKKINCVISIAIDDDIGSTSGSIRCFGEWLENCFSNIDAGLSHAVMKPVF